MPARKQSNMTLHALLTGIAEVNGLPSDSVQALALDSRDVVPGALFMACAGLRKHGSAYIDDAVRAGAVAVLWEMEPNATPLPVHWRSADEGRRVPVIGVMHLSQKLGLIADRFYGSPSRELFVVGITGTNGKTSCSHFLAQALHDEVPCGVIGTLGFGLFGSLSPATHTTPDAITCHRLLAQMRAEAAAAVVPGTGVTAHVCFLFQRRLPVAAGSQKPIARPVRHRPPEPRRRPPGWTSRRRASRRP